MIHAEVDLKGFEALVTELTTGLPGHLNELGRDLAEDALSYAIDRVNAMIYDTPLRYYNGELYRRTGGLRDSLNAFHRLEGDALTVTLETGPGAEGKRYGLRNEQGEGDSKVAVSRILADARRHGDPLSMPAYERQNDLEARPTVLPVMAALEDELPERVYDLLEAASR